MIQVSKAMLAAAGFAVWFGVATGAVASSLPPDMQRGVEMAHAANGAAAALDHQPADMIEWLGDDHYRVRAGRCSVEVRLADAPGFRPPSGRPVVATAGKPECK